MIHESRSIRTSKAMGIGPIIIGILCFSYQDVCMNYTMVNDIGEVNRDTYIPHDIYRS